MTDFETATMWARQYMPEGQSLRLESLLRKAIAAEREACAKLASNPYGDEVQAMGRMEPKEVGTRIAAAIRARAKP